MTSLAQKRLFLLPAVLIVFFVTIFPFFHTIILSFSNAQLYLPTPTKYFVGFGSWAKVFHDGMLGSTLVTTFFYVFVGLAIQYPAGLILALVLSRAKVMGRNFFQSAFLIPMLVSPIAAGFISGRMMFNYSLGPANDLLNALGFSSIKWLSSPWLARLVIVLIDSWKWMPFFMIFLLAGIESLPEDPYEAAYIDGASSWQVFRYIIFPQLVPISAIVIAIRSLMILRSISIPNIVTGGGPGIATENVTMYAYSTGLKGGNVAYGAAVSIALLVVAIILMTIFLSMVRSIWGLEEL